MHSICVCSFVYIYKICIYLYIAKNIVSRLTPKVNASFLRFSHDSLSPRVRSPSRVPLLATVSCAALLCTEDVSFRLTTLSVPGQLPCCDTGLQVEQRGVRTLHFFSRRSPRCHRNCFAGALPFLSHVLHIFIVIWFFVMSNI